MWVPWVVFTQTLLRYVLVFADLIIFYLWSEFISRSVLTRLRVSTYSVYDCAPLRCTSLPPPQKKSWRPFLVVALKTHTKTTINNIFYRPDIPNFLKNWTLALPRRCPLCLGVHLQIFPINLPLIFYPPWGVRAHTVHPLATSMVLTQQSNSAIYFFHLELPSVQLQSRFDNFLANAVNNSCFSQF